MRGGGSSTRRRCAGSARRRTGRSRSRRAAVGLDAGAAGLRRAACGRGLILGRMIHLSYSLLVTVVIAALLVGYWYDSIRAREAANRIAADACERRSLQFLDGTVALVSLRPRVDRLGFRFERTYTFDYTVDGMLRASGFVIMLGQELTHVGFHGGTA